ncbi:polysaccharide deacetylase YxkH [Rhodococcus triatomae BKS 15-14]|nr:polysaccharide deacetylase YxkH [Rhodococcus triatomae BKS 15-14]
MYHCIAEETVDPWAICVTPQSFDEHMAVLARAAVDLGTFTGDDAYTRGGGRIAVTFDDGYLDNLTAALPTLERHGVPATIFVIGNGVGRTREFWWDALQRALLSGPLPETLAFPFGTGPHTYTLDERPGDDAAIGGWRADFDAAVTSRQKLFRALWDAVVVLDPAEQDDAIDHLLDWAGQPTSTPATRVAVDEAQFAQLAAHPLITVGSHTLDHPSLTDLAPERQAAQIREGRRRMEELAGCPVTRFSYPYGRFDDTARAAVRDIGIEIACTSVPVPAVTGDDRHALPRLQPTEMDGDRFTRWLREDCGLLAGSAG